MPHSEASTETVNEALKTVLIRTLGLRQRTLDTDSPLLGSLPELDSMAVIALIAALEEHFNIEIDDEDIHARHFATLGTLEQFVAARLSPSAP